jgi:hypothetical protein
LIEPAGSTGGLSRIETKIVSAGLVKVRASLYVTRQPWRSPVRPIGWVNLARLGFGTDFGTQLAIKGWGSDAATVRGVEVVVELLVERVELDEPHEASEMVAITASAAGV